jgi:hypothetical protein
VNAPDPTARRWARIPRSPRGAAAATFVALAVMGAAWSLATPLMGAPDEPAHTVRAAAVARLQLRGVDQRVALDLPGWEGLLTTVQVPDGYARIGALPGCYAFQATRPADCAPAPIDDMTVVDTTTSAGTYPPLYYLAVGWPTRFLPPYRGVVAMRFLTVLACAALGAIAAASARRCRGPASVGAGLLVALTPGCFFLAGTVNPNAIEVFAAVATWIAALAVLAPRSEVDPALARADLVRLGAAFVVLSCARPLSPVLAVGIVAAVGLATARRDALAALWRRTDARVVAAVGGVAVAVSALWVLWARSYDGLMGYGQPGLTLGDAFAGSFDRLWVRAQQAIGFVGWNDAGPVPALAWIWSLLVVGLVLAGLARGTWRTRAALVVLMAASVAFTVVPEALSAERLGFIWQGRYSLPVAMGVPVLAGWMIGRRSLAPRLALPGGIAIAAAWVLGQFLGIAGALRRYMEGIDHPLLAYLDGGLWDPRVPPWLITAGLVLAAALLAATALRGAGVPQPPVDEGSSPATSRSSLAPNASSP